jgi:glycosyltransferase involved in cell wall biosynthesis
VRSIAELVVRAAEFGVPIVVSDGSIDGTDAVAEEAGAVVVRHERPMGYDAALNAGFRRAADLGMDFVVTMDGDGQHDPALIPEFVAQFAMGKVLVLGVRPTPARPAERLFAAYTCARYRIRDPLCGMKGYSMAAYRQLGHFDSYRSIGTELMLHCVRAGYPTVEVPVPGRLRRGTPRFGGALRANARILRSLALALLRPRR